MKLFSFARQLCIPTDQSGLLSFSRITVILMGLYKCISDVWWKKQLDPTKLFQCWEYTSKCSLSSLTRPRQIIEGRCARSQATQDVHGGHGISFLRRRQSCQEFAAGSLPPYQLSTFAAHYNCFARTMSSRASKKPSGDGTETKKEISTAEGPFDSITNEIPEKPVTFAEGSAYSVVILAGLGVAALAGFAVFKELIFEPKEYKIFGKALKRIQDDSQVRVRIGSPITGYGQESRNRAARQRIPNRIWTDEDGAEHVEVNFYIRGPHGNGKVYSEMFKDNADKEWKFTYLIVEIRAPSPSQLILESYMPAYNADK